MRSASASAGQRSRALVCAARRRSMCARPQFCKWANNFHMIEIIYLESVQRLMNCLTLVSWNIFLRPKWLSTMVPMLELGSCVRVLFMPCKNNIVLGVCLLNTRNVDDAQAIVQPQSCASASELCEPIVFVRRLCECVHGNNFVQSGFAHIRANISVWRPNMYTSDDWTSNQCVHNNAIICCTQQMCWRFWFFVVGFHFAFECKCEDSGNYWNFYANLRRPLSEAVCLWDNGNS